MNELNGKQSEKTAGIQAIGISFSLCFFFVCIRKTTITITRTINICKKIEISNINNKIIIETKKKFI